MANTGTKPGTWDFLKEYTSKPGEVGFGMPVDRFMSTMGGLASAIAPNYWAGRLGANMQAQGEKLYNQRMVEESPAYRLAKARTDELMRLANLPGGQVTTPGVQGGSFPTSRPVSTSLNAPKLTLMDPNDPNSFMNASNYGKASRQVLANLGLPPLTTQPIEPVRAPLGVAGAEGLMAERAMSDSERAYKQAMTQHVQGQTGMVGAQLNQLYQMLPLNVEAATLANRGTNAVFPYVAPQAEANVAHTQAQTGRLNAETANIPEHLRIQQGHLNLGFGNLNLGKQRFELDERIRQDAASMKSTQSLDTMLMGAKNKLNAVIGNPATPKREVPSAYLTHGTDVLGISFNHYNEAAAIGSPELAAKIRQDASSTAISGIGSMVKGIDAEQNFSRRSAGMTNLARSLKELARYDRPLAEGIVRELSGPKSPIRKLIEPTSFSNFLRTKEVSELNPAELNLGAP